ncbi:MAG: ABC transporter ATP-binding protein [Oscillospiraceae bacterium]|nr:ABC transporter ATP-binding protein [Oscillospiraceae bacterium]
MDKPILEVRDLVIRFHDQSENEEAVHGISFDMAPGKILGLVGESGSGKTVTALAIAGLLGQRAATVSGRILFCGQDLLTLEPRQMRQVQGKRIGMVFQEPMTCMNPLMKVGKQVEEVLRIHTHQSPRERRESALDALAAVEISDPERVYGQYPHELSGGMRQRAMLAAAICYALHRKSHDLSACRSRPSAGTAPHAQTLHTPYEVLQGPELLICDEPTTALDVTTQAQILALLQKVNRDVGVGLLFISHDLGLVRRLCSRTIVMQDGYIVEQGDVEELFERPQAAYTKQLLASLPGRGRRRE